MKHVTIWDVADKAKVSVSTVSRAFNDKYDVKKETKELVLRVADELGYHPNPIAQKLAQRKTLNIGVVVPEFVNAFFPEVIMGIQDVLLANNYQTLIMSSNESQEIELKNVKSLENHMVDGLLVSLSRETMNVEFFQDLVAKGMPVVFFNRTSNEIPTSKVIFDDYKWAFFATEHLVYQECKKIYHLEGDRRMKISQDRKRGYVKAMEKHHLEPRSIETGFEIEDGERVVQRLVDKGDLPDAFFCLNDNVALGAMRVLKKNKIKIPEDVALVGFTESAFSSFLDPALTSVQQPAFDMGQQAATLLLEAIEQEENFVIKEVMMEGRLNIRDSSTRK